MDPSGTDEFAHRRESVQPDACPSRIEPTIRRRTSEYELLGDPLADVVIDFNSQDGFRDHAKKKKKAATPFSLNDNNEKKDDNAGEGDGGNGGGGNGGGGDPGNNGAGDGAGDGAGGGDDDWATFTTAKSKKKGKGDAGGLPDIPTSDFGTDTFQEIKLGDDTGGKLDINFGTLDLTNSFGSSGTKWNTGGSTWDWSGGADKDTGDNPWSKPKKKDKSTFSFGSMDEPDDKPAKDDDWGFSTTTKKDKKKKDSMWDPAPENEGQDITGGAGETWGWDKKKKVEEVDDWFTPGGKKDKKKEDEDLWNTWGGAKKDKKKTSLLDDFGTPDPPPAPDAPPADDFWGAVTTKGSKKKKAGLFDDITETPPPDPPAATTMDDDFGWGLSSKKKKNSIFADDDPKDKAKTEEGWDLWGAGKKDTKKKKNSLFDDSVPEDPPKDDADIWDTWGGAKKGKVKKATDDLIQLDDTPAGGGGGDDDFFSSWGTGKKDKKKDTFSWADDADDTWDLGTKKDTTGKFITYFRQEDHHRDQVVVRTS